MHKINHHISKQLVLGTLLIGLLCAVSLPVQAQRVQPKPKLTATLPQSQSVPGEVIIKFNSKLSSLSTRATTTLQRADKQFGVTSIRSALPNTKNPELAKIYVVKFKSQKTTEIIKTLTAQKDVAYVSPNYVLEAFEAPDPLFNQQWYLHNPAIDIDIDALESFDVSAYGITAKKIEPIVAIVDQPMYIEHPDLKNSVWINKNEIPADNIDNDANGYIDDVTGCFFQGENGKYGCGVSSGSPTILDHGTKVAGLVGATHANNEGIKGGCPNCKIMRAGAPYFYANILEAISYSIENGAQVINMSWGYQGTPEGMQAMAELFAYAHQKGIVLVAATGNNNSPWVYAPARMQYVIGVASTDEENKKASFSTFGPGTDLSAPGGMNILTTIHTSMSGVQHNTYGGDSGTSFSSPLVAAAAGMVLSYDPTLPPDKIESILKETADPIVYDHDYLVGNMGAGKLNQFKALYKALNLKDIFKDTTIASVQCYENKTRLEIRDSQKVLIDGVPADHVLENVFHHWVENGKKITIEGTGWNSTMIVPNTCKLTALPSSF